MCALRILWGLMCALRMPYGLYVGLMCGLKGPCKALCVFYGYPMDCMLDCKCVIIYIYAFNFELLCSLKKF
jgi:hypothetical protein